MLLTTHYMDEAERLCDRVAIVDLGQVIALDSPRELIARLGGEHIIEFTLDGDCQRELIERDQLADLPAVSAVRQENGHLSLSVAEPHVVLPALIERLDRLGCHLTSLTTRHASLEDVFVKLAGKHLNDVNEVAMKTLAEQHDTRRYWPLGQIDPGPSARVLFASRRPCSGSTAFRS